MSPMRVPYPIGIAMMSILVIATNRLLWRPLYVYAERRARLD
jgi:NitT/TauT family transport system permease protein